MARSRELGVAPGALLGSLFADLRDENRLLRFEDITAQRLIDRYNVALAQAVLLRSVLVRAEVRNEKPARYRQLFRRLKFHRLLYRVEGGMRDGYVFHIDGPLSLFSATTKYGLQVAWFLPALLHCEDFRLDAELRWGPKREPRAFHLESSDGLISHQADSGTYAPAELAAFVERFRQVAPDWELGESTDVLELGREGGPGWPTTPSVHSADWYSTCCSRSWDSGRSRVSSDSPRLLPCTGRRGISWPSPTGLGVRRRGARHEVKGPILRFKEIPNATELAALLETFVGKRPSPRTLLFGRGRARRLSARCIALDWQAGRGRPPFGL